jgi:plastocyanin
MTRVKQVGAVVACLTVALAGCLPTVPAGTQAQATAVSAVASTSESASRQIQGVLATETVRSIPPTRAPLFAAEAPPATPFPSQQTAISTPLAPSQTVAAPPARPPLTSNSQAAANASGATAVAQIAQATATASGLPTQEIVMRDVAFAPSTLTVKPGTIVIWKNMDRVQHQVQGGEFDSGRIQAGSYWAATMSKAGRYAFICSFHPTMRAEINVSPDDTKPVQLST